MMKRTILFISITIFFLILTPKTIFSTPSGKNDYNELEVHFIDVGQGDSTLVKLPDGENILIDAGSPAAGPEIVKYLKSLGISKINHFILTHPHDDHIGGIFNVSSEFEVDNFYDNGFSNFKSNVYGDYIELVRKDLSKYNILQAGESLLLDNIKIEVLNPLLPPTGKINNDSIVLRLIYRDIKILLTGDIKKLGERRLLKINTELTSQILKVSHHGEDDTSSDDFLNNIKPEIAIISVNKINKNAQPHLNILKRLKQAGAKIYRTDQSGHITLKTNGQTFSIKTEKSFITTDKPISGDLQ